MAAFVLKKKILGEVPEGSSLGTQTPPSPGVYPVDFSARALKQKPHACTGSAGKCFSWPGRGLAAPCLGHAIPLPGKMVPKAAGSQGGRKMKPGDSLRT